MSPALPELSFLGGKVSFDSVTIEYGPLPVLAPGVRHGVYGSNGCGKSTLARCIAWVIPTVHPAGVDLRGHLGEGPLFGAGRPSISLLSVLPQNPLEFSLGLSVEEEWAVSTAHRKGRPEVDTIWDCCELSALGNRSSAELSCGERQRLSIACSIAHGSRWLLLDAWCSHLDEEWRMRLGHLLDEVSVKRGMGTIELTATRDRIGPSNHELHTLQHRDRHDDAYADVGSSTAAERVQELTRKLPRAVPPANITHTGHLRRGGFRRSVEPLQVRAGQVAVVVGSNGTGKTTLLKTATLSSRASGYSRPTLVLSEPSLQLAAKNLETLVRTVIPPGPAADLERALALIETAAGRSRLADPHSLNHAAGKMLAIALGMVHENVGLAIDEPFAGLDSASRSIVSELIYAAAFSSGKPVLITAQAMSDIPASLADQSAIVEI